MPIPFTGRNWGFTVLTHRSLSTACCIPRTPLKPRYSKCFGDQWAEFHEIDSADLALFDVCELQVTSPLKVVNATGRHLNRLGTDSGFFASTDSSKTQAWARSFMTHHQAPQVIRYNSRKNQARINYAVFGTPEAQAAIQVERRYPLPDHPDFYRLLLSYDVALL